MEHSLLNREDDKEAENDDELRHGVVKVHLVLILDLLENFCKTLLHIRHKVEQAGCYEDPTSETGGERDHKTPSEEK